MTMQHSGAQIPPPNAREVIAPERNRHEEPARMGHGPAEAGQSPEPDAAAAAAAWPFVAIGFGLVAVLAWVLFLGWLLGYALLAAF
jgi:hypothetical protein